ncbi:MAG: ParB/RepB/Spo0J family partition protein [Deltaproteobacteria bacterium]|nr:ParB/RepB/Spo0J family partition protein [Deltaproteobacteria bacterium]
MEKQEIKLIPIEKIDPPGTDQRDMIDPIKIVELAESIREKGLINPILLRPQNGRYEIVAGHRRFLAHQHLQAKVVPAILKEMDDVEVILYRAIENLQRENLTPMEEARAYWLMKTRGGMNIQETCRQTGKHENTVRRFLRIYEWPEYAQDAIEKKGLSIRVAEVLMDIDDSDMRKYYINMGAENGITLKVAEMWVSDYKKSKQGALFQETGAEEGMNVVPESRPVYVTCQCCYGAVEIREAKQLVVCGKCLKELRSTKKSSS